MARKPAEAERRVIEAAEVWRDAKARGVVMLIHDVELMRAVDIHYAVRGADRG